MSAVFPHYFFALVGGAYTTVAERVGWWCWTMDNASSNTDINNGARLIIWDLMCVSPSFS